MTNRNVSHSSSKNKKCKKNIKKSTKNYETLYPYIGTWNVFSGQQIEALAEYAKFCIENGIHILAVQETKRKSGFVEDWEFIGSLLKGWRFIGTGKLKSKCGVGFIVSPEVNVIETHDHADFDCWGRIISIRAEIFGLRLKVVNCYAPHLGYVEATKDNFYVKLRKCMNELDSFKRGQFVGLGDFNAVIGSQDSNMYGSSVGCNHRVKR